MGFFQDLFGTPSSYTSKKNDSANESKSQSSGRISFRDGVYDDPSRFDSDFGFRVMQDLSDTLKDYSTRNAVADLFCESRGGRGVTKLEIKEGLYRLVKERRLNEDQMWAVRRKYDIY